MADTTDKNTRETLERIAKRLDMILVILLAKSGVNQKEIAKIIGVTDRTIRNWLPFGLIKQTQKEEGEKRN